MKSLINHVWSTYLINALSFGKTKKKNLNSLLRTNKSQKPNKRGKKISGLKKGTFVLFAYFSFLKF